VEVAITELEEFDPDRVDGVKSGANGFPVLMLKALDESGEPTGPALTEDDVLELTEKADAEKADCKTCKGKGTIMAGNRKCPDCKGTGKVAADSDNAEKSCECASCIVFSDVKTYTSELGKATVSAADQNDLPDSDFAYIEPGGKKDAGGKTTPRSKRHFLINDAAHVRNALARASQSPFGKKAMPKILAAAKKFDIEVSDDSKKSIEIEVTKDGSIVSGVNPLFSSPTTTPVPGSPAWEAEDAQCATDAAQYLMQAAQLISNFGERESIEVAAGEGNDVFDAWDANCALDAVTHALGIMARLAFFENAEAHKESAEKAGKRLSAKSVSQIEATIAALKTLLAGEQAASDDDASKSGDILDMTKDELIQLLDERDEARRAAKEAKRAEKAEAKVAKEAEAAAQREAEDAERAAKRAEMTPEEIEAEEAAEAEAKAATKAAKAEEKEAATLAAVAVVKEAVDGFMANLDSLKDRLATVEKMAAPGGPVKTRTTADLNKATERDVLDLQIAEFEQRAKETTDSDLRRGYLDKAKAVRARLAETA